MGKPRVVWLAREGVWYKVFAVRPKLDQCQWYSDRYKDKLRSLCVERFESTTGFHLEPGTCQRVRINIEAVGPVRKG